MKLKFLAFILLAFSFGAFAQTSTGPWKKEQIMLTATLAEKIKTNATDKPIVFNVGPMENIKGSVFVGRATSATFADQMKRQLNMVAKTKTVVVYCGCCSFTSCPNLKPAYDALLAMGYTNARVLDLPVGIKEDWVQKGYPVEE